MKTQKDLKQESIEKIKTKALNQARAVAPKYCEKCGMKYEDVDFNLVQKNNGQSVFHLKCSRCANTYIINVVSPSPHVMASQRSSLNIDLRDAEEMTKFAGQKAVSKDEALDIYNTLQVEDLELLLTTKESLN